MSGNARRSRGSFREHVDDLIARFEGEQVTEKPEDCEEDERGSGERKPRCAYKLNQGLFERSSGGKRQ